MPQMAMAANPSSERAPGATDLRLGENGSLLGQVVTTQHAVVANAEVSLCHGDQVLARAATDQHGRFAFRGLDRGVYQLVAAGQQQAYRAWPQSVAPPAARSNALIVVGGETVRGQCGQGSPLCNFLTHPLLIAGVVAAAIAIPVAIHNNKKPSSP